MYICMLAFIDIRKERTFAARKKIINIFFTEIHRKTNRNSLQ